MFNDFNRTLYIKQHYFSLELKCHGKSPEAKLLSLHVGRFWSNMLVSLPRGQRHLILQYFFGNSQ